MEEEIEVGVVSWGNFPSTDSSDKDMTDTSQGNTKLPRFRKKRKPEETNEEESPILVRHTIHLRHKILESSVTHNQSID